MAEKLSVLFYLDLLFLKFRKFQPRYSYILIEKKERISLCEKYFGLR